MIVAEVDEGQRLDRWLKKIFPELPFGQMQKILRTGQVRVDGKRVKGETRLKHGQEVRIPPQLTMPMPKKERGLSRGDIDFIQSLVIYKDDHLIAVNKPSGLATQGGTKIGTHIDGLLEGLKYDGLKPHLVHRLDKDTSGVLLLARSPKIAAAMGALFKDGGIRKYYWAVTTPAPDMRQGKIKSSLMKAEGRGGERVVVVDEEEGKSALTFYNVMESVGGKVAWVAFWPRTGRMHQIRVHAAQIGCPLLGDHKYGDPAGLAGEPNLSKTLHLHARRVMFPHPVTGKKVDIAAALSDGMLKTFKYFGFNAADKSDPFEEVED